MIDFKSITNSGTLYNFHSHTQFCDGHDEMANFVKEAVRQGFSDYGFTPHSPVPFHTTCNMPLEKVDDYMREVNRLRAEYGDQIHLYAAMEIDYVNDWGPSSEYFKSLPLDYRIGAVHFLPSFTQDNEFVDIDGRFEHFQQRMSEHFYDDIDAVVLSFYTQSLKMIEEGGFDIIAHFDKIGHNASMFRSGIEDEPWYDQLVKTTFEAIMDCGLVIEINTKAYNRCGRMFPNVKYWDLLAKYNAQVIINSDAHLPDLINAGRMEAKQMYSELLASIV